MTRILFVCTGNTCRSPMAEAILKNKKLPGIDVKSAGVFAADGHEASKNAKAVLTENNIEHHHQSSMLTEELVDWATYILTMTGSHKASVMNLYPAAKDKTFTLKEFAEEGSNQDIIDPFGGPLGVYRNTYEEMEKLIDKILHKIIE